MQIGEIITHVSEVTGVSISSITAKNKKSSLPVRNAKFLVMIFARQNTELNNYQILEHIGYIQRSERVTRGIKAIMQAVRLKRNKELCEQYKRLSEMYQSSVIDNP